jgi:hypothetical protein
VRIQRRLLGSVERAVLAHSDFDFEFVAAHALLVLGRAKSFTAVNTICRPW